MDMFDANDDHDNGDWIGFNVFSSSKSGASKQTKA